MQIFDTNIILVIHCNATPNLLSLFLNFILKLLKIPKVYSINVN